MSLESVDPTRGETIARYDEMSASEVALAVEAAHAAFLDWRESSFEERGAPLWRAAALLRERAEELALLMAAEMGKTLREGRAEVDKCALACEHYAAEAGRLLAPELVPTEASKSYVTFRPLGVVLAIMPWNFPLWQVLRFAVPGLMAGNAAVLKHASNVQGCALAIEEILANAGLPAGLFRTLCIGSAAAGELIEHPKVAAVTLTGSTAAGRAVAARAGAALKKCVLELGGSDAYVVLEDADLELAVDACVRSRLVNAGQSCIAAKRFVVPESIRGEFEERFVGAMREKRTGDPRDEASDIGPLARADLREELHRQVRSSIAGGARLLLGGELPEGPGAFYPPTVLSEVRPGTPAYGEELFGPVAAILPARDEEDALRIANDSSYGLGAAVFTRDLERGERIAAEHLEAGSCFVNDFVRSDPRLPFGGIKDSGYGRELASHGIKEFVNVKTVWVR